MPYRPSPRQLQYFLAVAERGHFAEAAKTCHVSQPTLSSQLKLLEDQLGVTLIERGTALARPTSAGQRLMPLARLVLGALDEIVELAGTTTENLGGLIRLGVAPTFGPYFLPWLLPRLHAAWPSLEIYIREDRPGPLEAGLQDGTIDCILTPLIPSITRFAHVPLCSEAIFLGLPAEHPLAGAPAISTSMLAGEKLLTLGRGYRLYEQVQQLCEASGSIMRDDYEGTSLDALRQMVSIGMGLSLFPAAYAASEFRKETDVALRQISDWPIARTLCLAWRRESGRTGHFETLAREAMATIGELKITGLDVAGTR